MIQVDEPCRLCRGVEGGELIAVLHLSKKTVFGEQKKRLLLHANDLGYWLEVQRSSVPAEPTADGGGLLVSATDDEAVRALREIGKLPSSRPPA